MTFSFHRVKPALKWYRHHPGTARAAACVTTPQLLDAHPSASQRANLARPSLRPEPLRSPSATMTASAFARNAGRNLTQIWSSNVVPAQLAIARPSATHQPLSKRRSLRL